MNPFFCFHDCFCRIIKRKKTLLCLLLLFLCSTMCGILFINSPSFYDYHLRICDRFLDRVCYSQTSVFLIFVRRTAGHCFILALIFISGVHPAACVFTPIALIYRGYTFGGGIFIFFGGDRFSGAVVAVVLYIPIYPVSFTHLPAPGAPEPPGFRLFLVKKKKTPHVHSKLLIHFS